MLAWRRRQAGEKGRREEREIEGSGGKGANGREGTYGAEPSETHGAGVLFLFLQTSDCNLVNENFRVYEERYTSLEII